MKIQWKMKIFLFGDILATLFSFFFFLNWSIVNLQYCVSFKCPAVHRLYIYLGIYLYTFWIPFHYSLLQDTEYSSLCYTVNPCCLYYLIFTMNCLIEVCMCICTVYIKIIEETHIYSTPSLTKHGEYIRRPLCIPPW